MEDLSQAVLHQQDAGELKNKEKMKQMSKDIFPSLLWSFKGQLICEVYVIVITELLQNAPILQSTFK